MRAVTTLLVALLWASSVFAQATLQQGGSTTQGRVPAYWSTGSQQPIVIDSGPAGGNVTGQGISELNITARGTGAAPYAGQGTGNGGTVFQIQDAVSTNSTGYHFLGLSANAGGGGLLNYGAAGGAANLPLTFRVNGTNYQFPFTTGSVIGPGLSTVGHVACWNNTVGTLLSDCGSLLTVGGSNGQIQFNNAGALGGFTLGGDATVNTGTGALTITKIGGQTATLGGTLDTAGALTTSAAFATAGGDALTLTTTAATNVTLPTTGTLATLAGGGAFTNKTYNGLTIDATTGTFDLTNAKTLAVTNSLTLSGTDGSTLNMGTGGTLGTAAYTAASAYVPANTQLTNSLSANVLMNNTAQHFTGPQVAQGSSGTWFASGTVTVNDTGAAATIHCRLTDGSTFAASTVARNIDGVSPVAVPLSGIFVNPSGNIRITCRDLTATTGVILWDASGNNHDSTLSVFRLN